MAVWPLFNFKRFRSRNARKFQRVRMPLLIRYQIRGENGGKVTNLNDLAAGGVRFSTEDPIPVGARLRLKVKLPWREQSLDVMGKVTRCIKVKGTSIFRVAAQFVGMKKEEVAEVESFVDAIVSERRRRKKELR